ncbi:MAG TPA: biotin--[acetyl-CoA-carboxylase] ligase [Beijerinckiaceae bacterium]|nr:biotin--[acetyl-CoA-carboxylase] ligase [Beijerinckiaceae bacterium]
MSIAAFRFEHFSEIASTNDAAMARARSGDAGHLWLSADVQTSGRGRHNRPWTSPSGNLYASLLLIDPSVPAKAPQLGFVAGVALVDALRDFAPDIKFALKWPNDLLVGQAKLAGILLEGSSLPDRRFACVLGCGVNCVNHPDGLAYAATDLKALGLEVAPSMLLQAFAITFARWLDVWAAGEGFAFIRAAWLERAAGFGGPVRVNLGGQMHEGRFADMDAAGRLILDKPDGRVTIDAGDVFLGSVNRPPHVNGQP